MRGSIFGCKFMKTSCSTCYIYAKLGFTDYTRVNLIYKFLRFHQEILDYQVFLTIIKIYSFLLWIVFTFWTCFLESWVAMWELHYTCQKSSKSISYVINQEGTNRHEPFRVKFVIRRRRSHRCCHARKYR